METARIEKRIGVRASTDRIWELVADLPHWERWNPIETSVGGTIAYGGEITLSEAIADLPERRVAARVGEWQPYAQLVWMERRGLWFRSMRYFEIEQLEPGSCVVSNGFIFSGLRGEMFFDKHRKRLRHGVDAIAEGWKTAAEA